MSKNRFEPKFNIKKGDTVIVLTGNDKGILSFTTDSEMSGLTLEKDTYVTSWEINLNPDDADKIMYKYTISGPEGDVFTASSTLSRI